MPIVTDAGFAPDDWTLLGDAGDAAADWLSIAPLAQFVESDGAYAGVAVANDTEPETLAPWLDRLAMIRIAFPSFADGRGFTLARRLRAAGYRGRLRAAGHVIADQYGFARACGFDEVEIDDTLAARQPAPQWRRAAPGHGLIAARARAREERRAA